ncbi:MAG: tetratricopeptide repeat protein [Moraxellaceae bacterium]|nr:tetratricopeptide repeat protein [Moraxellaceae bacterium]
MRLNALFLALGMSVSMPLLAADAVLQQADALIRLQAPDKAYEILAPLEEQRSGNPEYDYLLGVALLEKGEPQNAIFAFERCLAVEPKNGPCRVQMARTHLALGETDNARAELEVVNAYNPPPEVKQIVNQYLGAVDNLEKQQKRRITAYAQAGIGYDSNINSAPDDANKFASALPQYKGFTNPTADDSTYASLSAGSGIVYKATNDVNLLADINAQTRSFFDDHNFDYQAADASLGASFNLETFVLMTKLQGQKMWLDGKSYRDITGGLAQVQSSLGQGQMALFLQSNKLSYSSQSARDAKRKNVGIAYSQAIDAQWTPSFYVSAYTGSEDVDIAVFQSQDFDGLRLGGSLTLMPNVALNSQLSYEKRDYNKALVPFFLINRADKESSVGININWKINKNLSLQPNYTYTQNQSNIALSDYTRHVMSVDLRFDM